MQSKILIVDDNPDMIRLMGKILSSMGQLRFATSATAALHLARELIPDLILLDTEMPGMNGYEMCEALKADSALCEVPVIFVTDAQRRRVRAARARDRCSRFHRQAHQRAAAHGTRAHPSTHQAAHR